MNLTRKKGNSTKNKAEFFWRMKSHHNKKAFVISMLLEQTCIDEDKQENKS
jgi:hypothetical protein